MAAFVGKLPDLDAELAKLTAPPPVAVGAVNQDVLIHAWSQYTGLKAQPISDAAKAALGLTKES